MSTDFSQIASAANNKIAMHQASARKSANDQFAQIFAQNEADASRRSFSLASTVADAQAKTLPPGKTPEHAPAPARSRPTTSQKPVEKAPVTDNHEDIPHIAAVPRRNDNGTDIDNDKPPVAAKPQPSDELTPNEDHFVVADTTQKDASPTAEKIGSPAIVFVAPSQPSNGQDSTSTNVEGTITGILTEGAATAKNIAAELAAFKFSAQSSLENTNSKNTDSINAAEADADGLAAKLTQNLLDLKPSDGNTSAKGSKSDAKGIKIPDLSATENAAGSKPSLEQSVPAKLEAALKAANPVGNSQNPANASVSSGKAGPAAIAEKAASFATSIAPAQALQPVGINPAFALPALDIRSFETGASTKALSTNAAVSEATATLGNLPVSIGSRALKGAREFTIHLDPAELGKVEVRLEINDNGEVKANLTVDRVETLQLLQRDSKTLERALEQAGFKPSDDALQFSLRQDSGQRNMAQDQSWSQNSKSGLRDSSRLTEDLAGTRDVTAAAMAIYARRANAALDIHI